MVGKINGHNPKPGLTTLKKIHRNLGDRLSNHVTPISFRKSPYKVPPGWPTVVEKWKNFAKLL